MIKKLITLCIFLCTFSLAKQALASFPEWGIQAGRDCQFSWSVPKIRHSRLVGADLALPLGHHVVLQPSVEYAVLTSEYSNYSSVFTASNVDIVYRTEAESTPIWLGAGLGEWYEISSRVREDARMDTTARLTAGIGHRVARVLPFVQISTVLWRSARYVHTFGSWPPDRHDVVVVVGMRFGFGQKKD
jgi:hypothetical protein